MKAKIRAYHSLPTYRGDNWQLELVPSVYIQRDDQWSGRKVWSFGISWLGVGIEIEIVKNV